MNKNILIVRLKKIEIGRQLQIYTKTDEEKLDTECKKSVNSLSI